MPLHQHITPDTSTNIWIWEASESNEELLSKANNLGWTLDIAHISGEQRRREIITTHLLMSLAGITAIQHNTDGRPYCREYHSISLSHSKQWVTLATHQSSTIGIDIECITDRVLRVATRFMNEQELSYLSPDDLQTMLISWCAKETAYKIIGHPATDFRATLRIHPFNAMQEGNLRIEHLTSSQILTLHYQSSSSHYMLVYGVKQE